MWSHLLTGNIKKHRCIGMSVCLQYFKGKEITRSKVWGKKGEGLGSVII